MEADYCTFCEIVAGRLPSHVRHHGDEIIVFGRLRCFTPRVRSARGYAYGPACACCCANHAACGGALQTQHHGHLHVIGGARLGLYVQ